MKLLNVVAQLVKHPTDKTSIQFFRYVFVGGMAFIVDFGSLYLFTDIFGVFYLISATIAFILGLITNYILSINWVFNQYKFDNRTSEFTIFGLIGIVGLLLNELFIWVFTSEIGLYYLISKIIAAVIILFWNFFARKYVLFK